MEDNRDDDDWPEMAGVACFYFGPRFLEFWKPLIGIKQYDK